MNEDRPRVGEIVHYVMHEGPRAGAHRPAIVVNANGMGLLNLQVISDGNRKKGDQAPGMFWRHDVPNDPKGVESGTWHRPEVRERDHRNPLRELALHDPSETGHDPSTE